MEPANDLVVLGEIFQNEQIGSLQDYVKRLSDLHHRYLETQFAIPHVQQKPIDIEELLRFAIDAQFLATEYTNPLVTERQPGLPTEDVPGRKIVQDALSVAGTIFEFLGDTVDSLQEQNSSPDELAEIHQRIGYARLLYLKAALCYGLGIYESRTRVILRRLLNKVTIPHDILNVNNAKQWQEYLLMATLNCDFRQLSYATQLVQEKVVEMRQQLRQSLDNNKIFDAQNRWSIRDLHALQASLSLIDACMLCKNVFLKGQENIFEQVVTRVNEAIGAIRKNGDYEFEWIVRTFRKVISRTWENSPWIQLGPYIPRRAFIKSLVRDGIIPLWSSQLAALEMRSRNGILPGGYLNEQAKRVVMHMPTSAGKTLLAQLAIASQFFSQHGKNFIYVGPSRALCDQVANDLANRLARFGIRVTSVVSDNDLIDNHYESLLFVESTVIVVTPEKLSSLFRQQSTFLYETTLFIFDELHNIGKKDRGWIYEEFISLCLLHPRTRNAKMLFLSAVMPNHLAVQEWVDPEQNFDALSQDWQPTRTLKGVIQFLFQRPSRSDYEIILQGDLLYVRNKEELHAPQRINNFISSKQVRDQKVSDRWKINTDLSDNAIHHASAAAERFAKLGPVLIYCPTREDAVKCADQLLINRGHDNINNPDHYNEIIEFMQKRLSPGHPLVKMLRSRIAFHHGRLPQDVRNEIEFAFQKGWIQLLVATTTLVEGVNFPIKTLLLMDYCQRYWDHKERKWQKYHNMEMGDFKNIAGRAGRALYETEGQVVIIQSINGYPYTVFDRGFEKYLSIEANSPELDITSSLENEDLLSALSQIVEEVDNGTLADDQLLFDPQGTTNKQIKNAADIVEKLQVFTLLLQDQNLVGEDEESFISIFQGTFLGKRQPGGASQILGALTHRSARAMRTHISEENRTLFAQTGLKISTCFKLMEKVQRYWKSKSLSITSFLQSSLDENILHDIGNIIYNLHDPEIDPASIKVSPRRVTEINHVMFFAEWISYDDPLWAYRQFQSIQFSRDKIENISLKAQAETSYTRDTLEYKASWVLSAFWLFSKAIVNNFYGVELISTDLGQELILLPTYAKFGVNTPAAALFSTLGFSPAHMARELSRIYTEQHSLAIDRYNYRMILQWLLKSEPTDLEHHGLQTMYIRRVIRLLSKLKPLDDEDAVQETEQSWEANFKIAGLQYSEEGKSILHTLHKGQVLYLKPEPEHSKDANAIQILTKEGHRLGYVPRYRNQELGEQMAFSSVKTIISNINLNASFYDMIGVHCWTEEK